MADGPTIHLGENSPEYVAYRLAERVITVVEGKKLQNISRKEFLDTYAECAEAVRGGRYPDGGGSWREKSGK